MCTLVHTENMNSKGNTIVRADVWKHKRASMAAETWQEMGKYILQFEKNRKEKFRSFL